MSAPHIISNYEDQVTVFWDTGICTTVSEDGAVEQHYRVPEREPWALLDSDEAIVYVLDYLKEHSNLSKQAWKQITECFEGWVE